MKRTANKFATLLTILTIMIASCREPVDNAYPGGEGIEQEWKDDEDSEMEEGNDTIIDEDSEKNSRNERDRSVKP